MKTKDLKKLKQSTQAQLEKALEKTQEEILKLRLKTDASEKDVHQPRKLRKKLAIIKTLIREKQLEDKNNKKEKSA